MSPPSLLYENYVKEPESAGALEAFYSQSKNLLLQ